MSVYRTIGPLVLLLLIHFECHQFEESYGIIGCEHIKCQTNFIMQSYGAYCSGLANTVLFTVMLSHLSLVLRKPAFCIWENKDADQLRGNREADQRLCFH